MKKRIELSIWAIKYNYNKKALLFLINPKIMNSYIFRFLIELEEIILLSLQTIVSYTLFFLTYPLDVFYNILDHFIITPVRAFIQYDEYKKIKEKIDDMEKSRKNR